jgi:hypothetical protein
MIKMVKKEIKINGEECLWNRQDYLDIYKQEVLGRIAYFTLIDMDHIENNTSNNSSIVAHVLVATVMFLLSCCLAMIGGYTYRD